MLDAPTDYSEACLSFCDLAPRCHARALDGGRPDRPRRRGQAAPRRHHRLASARAHGRRRARRRPRGRPPAAAGRLMSVRTRDRPQAAGVGGGPPAAAVRHDPPRDRAARPGDDRRVRPHGRRVAPVGDRVGHGRLRAAHRVRPRRSCPRRRRRACAPTFAEDLLEHLRVHNWTFDPVAAEAPSRASSARSGSPTASTSRCSTS